MHNSLASERCGSNLISIIFELVVQNSSLATYCEIALRWRPQNLSIDKSRQQVITWSKVDKVLWCDTPWLGHNELIPYLSLVYMLTCVTQVIYKNIMENMASL